MGPKAREGAKAMSLFDWKSFHIRYIRLDGKGIRQRRLKYVILDWTVKALDNDV